MPGKAAKVEFSEKQRKILQEFSDSRSVPQFAKQRASLLLLACDGLDNLVIAENVGLNRLQVGVWRRRWQAAWPGLCQWEQEDPGHLKQAVLEVLRDAPRSGAPPKTTPEQVAQIVAVACEPPGLCGRPITTWTQRELRDEVILRKIVATISRAQIGRYLRESATRPHLHKMWLNTREKDPEKFEREVATACQTYLEAPAKSAANGTHTVSVDEATSLQAVERKAADKPPLPGSIAKQEYEYTRHGTTTLTAGLDVVSGRILSPTLEPTRTEPQFVAHLQRTVALDPCGEWVFVVDNLNTHYSETLVRWVAEQCHLTVDLGKKRSVES